MNIIKENFFSKNTTLDYEIFISKVDIPILIITFCSFDYSFYV